MKEKIQKSTGLSGAILIGLGSILGTGAYLSLGLAADPGLAGYYLPFALLAAGLLALLNGLSSAQLAAVHPVSGGTYEYANRFIGPHTGFLAGWMFLCAKSASAATAALALAEYIFSLMSLGHDFRVPAALLIVSLVTLFVLLGLRRTNRLNLFLVLFAAGGLMAFILYIYLHAQQNSSGNPVEPPGLYGFASATALLFVAFTGYGRIATMGEEVYYPQRTIPLAVVITLLICVLLYTGVALAGLHAAGPKQFFHFTLEGSPLPLTLKSAGAGSAVVFLVVAGAFCALTGVLLNLIPGLSRVWMAMGRRGDLPAGIARLNTDRTSPVTAVTVTGVVTGLLCLTGNLQISWTFSALTVLVYYGLTNLCAMRMPANERKLPFLVPLTGFLTCLLLVFFIPVQILIYGMIAVAAGFSFRAFVAYFLKNGSSDNH